jgi:hypothetical protein
MSVERHWGRFEESHPDTLVTSVTLSAGKSVVEQPEGVNIYLTLRGVFSTTWPGSTACDLVSRAWSSFGKMVNGLSRQPRTV